MNPWKEVCQRCGREFDRKGQRGPIPTWCSFACRQRAYRARAKRRAFRAILGRVAS